MSNKKRISKINIYKGSDGTYKIEIDGKAYLAAKPIVDLVLDMHRQLEKLIRYKNEHPEVIDEYQKGKEANNG